MVSTGRVERAMLMRTQESGENSSSSSIVHRKEAKPVEIDGQDYIYSVVVLADGKHVLSGGREGKIRRWRIEDSKEVGRAMDARSPVLGIAVLRDGKVIVSGTENGLATVWNVESLEFKGHSGWVGTVDVSPDGTKVVTGSDDKTAFVLSLSTGEQLLGPLHHNHFVVAAICVFSRRTSLRHCHR